MAMAVAMVLVSCTGGSEAEPVASGEPISPDTVASAPSPTDDSTFDRVDVDALQADPPDTVDPSATQRCDRFEYPCSWLELDNAVFDGVTELASEVQAAVDAADSPEAGLDAAVELLAEMPVVELIVDREGYTGMLYRLDGTPELFATTSNAAPIGEPVDLDLTEVQASVDELASTGAAGLTMPRTLAPVLRDFHPTGGPIVPKRGIVIDPQADNEVACPIEGQVGPCFEDGDGRIEGSAIVGMMNAHPQVSAVHLAGLDATPWNIADLSGYDLVHVASHGSSGCANSNQGWTRGSNNIAGSDDRAGFVEEQRSAFQNTELDPDRCYSLTVLAPYNIARYQEFKRSGQQLPAGVGFNGSTWAVVDSFFLQSLGPQSIVYLSHCTSGDGQLLRSGRFGSFVGWHSYARTTVAYQAGAEFWRLMVAEGVEFELAIDELDDASLTSTVTAGFGDGSVGVAGAFLATSGRNLRARDVIVGKLDGGDWDGKVLDVNGKPGDADPERFPAGEQALTFELEGVRTGSEGVVTVEVYKDDAKLESDIDLARDGAIVQSGDEWDTWRITVKPDAIEFGPTTGADFAPGASFELEVRAFAQQDEYTADIGTVRLNTDLASTGPLPIFEELERGLPVGGYVEGNELLVEFETKGGPVTGDLEVTFGRVGIEIAFWRIQLQGDYDPATGSMSGTLDSQAQAGLAGITDSGSSSGQWEASVDLDAGTVTGTFGFLDFSQPYIGQIRDAS